MDKDVDILTMVLYRYSPRSQPEDNVSKAVRRNIWPGIQHGPIRVRGRNLYLSNPSCTTGVLLVWDNSKYVDLVNRGSYGVTAIMEEDVYANIVDHFCLEVMPC